MRSTSPGKKATFSLRNGTLAQLDALVARGAAPSKNALVERALVREFEALRRAERAQAWERASKDVLLLRDVEDVDRAFGPGDVDPTSAS